MECVGCRYELAGLPVVAGFVTCPECNARNEAVAWAPGPAQPWWRIAWRLCWGTVPVCAIAAVAGLTAPCFPFGGGTIAMLAVVGAGSMGWVWPISQAERIACERRPPDPTRWSYAVRLTAVGLGLNAAVIAAFVAVAMGLLL